MDPVYNGLAYWCDAKTRTTILAQIYARKASTSDRGSFMQRMSETTRFPNIEPPFLYIPIVELGKDSPCYCSSKLMFKNALTT